MKKYKIQVTETFQKVIEVEAENLSDAVIKVSKDYNDGEIEFDDMDLKDWKVKEFKEDSQ